MAPSYNIDKASIMTFISLCTSSKALRPLRLRLVFLLSGVLSLIFLNCYDHSRVQPPQSRILLYEHPSLVCLASDLQDDILVVLRTGATELLQKLPIHFKTTLKCFRDYVIYSDMNEDLEGHRIHDVLSGVNKTNKENSPEFELYNHLHAHGRENLDFQTIFGSGPSGALGNPGWKLDKWKFLPAVEQALEHRPHAKWYVFIESDTYMIWHNMLEWLSKFDADKPYYLGKHMYISDVLFGHGGSGFVLSNPAMHLVVNHWRVNREDLDRYTEQEWAGDMILGKVIKDAGIDMFWAWPHLQGDSLYTIDWNISKLDKQAWCYAPTTFHHMSQDEFRLMWHLEQAWHRHNAGKTLRFRDIFKTLVRPRLQAERGEWDNMSAGVEYSQELLTGLPDQGKDALSPVEREAAESFEACRAVCESKPACIQFSYLPGKCSTATELRLGRAADLQCLEYSSAAGACISSAAPIEDRQNLIRSGWIMDRIPDYVHDMDLLCESAAGNDWIM
ncbi:hypothetical protein F5Y15DRAFT_186899 [Xylariaceae sp. FL0016]|nr:hypothetical protein F5Y15DRAFT_186899 [Xylariaceae sp. FL0016]